MNIKNNKFINLYKNIFSPQWKYGNLFLYVSILISFSIIAYYNLSKGFVVAPDTSDYSKWSNNLINLDLNIFAYINQQGFAIQNIFYIIPVLIFALSKIFFGIEWQTSLLILNIILVFFSFIFFSKSLLLLKVRPLVVSMTLPILVLSVDLLVWPRYLLTDTIFSFLTIMTVYLMILSIVKEKNYYFFLFFCLISLCFTRPTSFPYIFALISLIALLKIFEEYKPKVILYISLILIIIIPFILAIFYQLMNFFFIESQQAIFLIEMVQKGMIIHDRPETWTEVPNTFLKLVKLYLLRFIFFFASYVENFSMIHIVLNLFQTFVIIVSILIWFFLGENFKFFNKTVTLIIIMSIFVASFHSFTLIDYDFRYRFPLIMPIILIFPISIEILLRKIAYESFKY